MNSVLNIVTRDWEGELALLGVQLVVGRDFETLKMMKRQFNKYCRTVLYTIKAYLLDNILEYFVKLGSLHVSNSLRFAGQNCCRQYQSWCFTTKGYCRGVNGGSYQWLPNVQNFDLSEQSWGYSISTSDRESQTVENRSFLVLSDAKIKVWILEIEVW